MFRKNTFRIIAALLILTLLMGLTSCGTAGSEGSDRDVETLTATVAKDSKFDSPLGTASMWSSATATASRMCHITTDTM